MKKKVVYFIIIALSIVLLNCNGNDKKGNQKIIKKEIKVVMQSGIIGKWEVVEATGTLAKLNKGTKYDFSKDGTLIIKKGFENKATYTFKNNLLTVKAGSVVIKSKVIIKNNIMTMQIENNDQKLILKRQ